MLKIHEFTNAAGELSEVCLRWRSSTLELLDVEGVWPLPPEALSRVMLRYGAPVDGAARSRIVASLELGNTGVLRHVRHLAGYDVIARDYLVHESPGKPALCALAIAVAGALAHLARAAQARP